MEIGSEDDADDGKMKVKRRRKEDEDKGDKEENYGDAGDKMAVKKRRKEDGQENKDDTDEEMKMTERGKETMKMYKKMINQVKRKMQMREW